MTEVAQPTITERLVSALAAAWRAIQQQHPEVPEVVLTLASGISGTRGRRRLGHFAEASWQRASTQDAAGPVDELHELFVGAEGLRRGAPDVFGTLLHEAAHGLATARGVVDTSRQGRYHNKRFKAHAEEVGLTVAEDGARGWAHTELALRTATRYAPVLEQLADALTAYRVDELPADPRRGKSKSRNILALCGCTPSNRIRASRATLDRVPITCGLCGQLFRAEDDTGGEDGSEED